MEILIKAAQLILSLGILVLIHELGHFVFARIFKVRVEKFYLFFDAGLSLFKYKPKNSDTEYGIGWLPLGGYCKISGMIDESMDTEQLAKDPEVWEFRSKPAWQRFLIMFGGALFNVLLAFVIYSMVLFCWGERYISNADIKTGIECDSIAFSMGFKDGDKIVALDNQPVEHFDKISRTILYKQVKSVKVDRKGSILDIAIDPDQYTAYLAKGVQLFGIPSPFIVDSLTPESHNAGKLEKNDQIIAINGTETLTLNKVSQALSKNIDQTVDATVIRGIDTLAVNLNVNKQGKIGIFTGSSIKWSKVSYGFFESIPAGVVKAYQRIKDQLFELKLMVTPKTETYKQVGSFLSIGNIYASTWDWQSFWAITGLLSVMLAVVNLLPIPALDGGHILFLLYEMITRRKPSDKFLGYAQIVGMVILLAIMVFALGNDIFRHIIK